MRLIVTRYRDHQRRLQRQYPDDRVVVIGEALYGHRFSEIVDETDPDGAWTEWERRWWAHARTRIAPDPDLIHDAVGIE